MPLTSSSTYQPRRTSPRPIGLINAAARALGQVGIAPARIDQDQLIELACRRSGLRDFGPGDFDEPLAMLVESLVRDASLTFVGRIVARTQIFRLLANRLRMEDERRRTPGLDETRVHPVIFITGLPRSGTSFLHGLLSQDPSSRAPRVWETLHPCPAPDRAATSTVDRRIAIAERQVRWVNRLAPQFNAIHAVQARLPQECIDITSHSFLSPVFETMYWTPSYARWLEQQDMSPAYQLHRQFLQHLQWRSPAARWVLKAPDHLFALRSLVQTYPDAMIIQTHREPREVLASVASLLATLRGAFSDRIDPKAIGREVLQRWSRGIEQAEEARRDPAIGGGRFFDVRYEDLVRDPLQVVDRIYEYFELELSAAVLARMREHLRRSPRNLRPRHVYTLEMFGSNPDEVDERFLRYRQRFVLGERRQALRERGLLEDSVPGIITTLAGHRAPRLSAPDTTVS